MPKKSIVSSGVRSTMEVDLPKPSRALYSVKLPTWSEMRLLPPDAGEELCVRRDNGVLVVFTRKKSQ